mmetsp:Transcript_56896/g.101536  ORF Transcript_56896/g.101536 Transcript_56896/m.101536 type:complete len:208 (+) Transcript_56896:841-1464(+)
MVHAAAWGHHGCRGIVPIVSQSATECCGAHAGGGQSATGSAAPLRFAAWSSACEAEALDPRRIFACGELHRDLSLDACWGQCTAELGEAYSLLLPRLACGGLGRCDAGAHKGYRHCRHFGTGCGPWAGSWCSTWRQVWSSANEKERARCSVLDPCHLGLVSTGRPHGCTQRLSLHDSEVNRPQLHRTCIIVIIIILGHIYFALRVWT